MRTLRLASIPVALLVLGLGATSSRAGPDAAPPRVRAHDLTVRLDPERRRLVAVDRIAVDAPDASALRLRLAPELVVRSVLVGGKRADVVRGDDGGFVLDVPAGTERVLVRYDGEVFDAVRAESERELGWVVGDDTRGVISERGVYLAPSSRWVPVPSGPGLARYRVRTLVPAPFRVVTQGRLAGRAERRIAPAAAAGEAVVPASTDAEEAIVLEDATWEPDLPTDGLSLSAGPYAVQSREVEGVRVSTYFFEEHAELAPIWLDAAEQTVRRYAPLLGPYPHAKFDVVENFFQSGYGMPSYTLLGDRVIAYVSAKAKREGGRIPPGYLDHEYVHGWFGNGLFVDYAAGNWCEALTTYYSNYYAEELESDEAAKAHRRRVLEQFAIRVHDERDYPLRAFTQKAEAVDDEVGYGKGSMLFHMIRRHVGSERFFEAVRTFTQSHLGRVVSWEDWLEAFSRAAGEDLAAHYRPWIDRPGLPELVIERVEVLPADPEIEVPARAAEARFAKVRVVIRQAGGAEPWPMGLPRVRIRHLGGRPDLEAGRGRRQRPSDQLSDGVEVVETHVELRAFPLRIELDPDFHVLRRIPDEELPAGLNRTLEHGRGVVAVAGEGSEALSGLARRLARQEGFVLAGEVPDLRRHEGAAVVLEIAGEGHRGLRAGGRTWNAPGHAVLRSETTPRGPRTRYTAMSEAAAARAGYVPFYGWDTWVVFENGRPVARGTDRPPSWSAARWVPAPGTSGARMQQTLERLTEAPRETGSEAHREVAAWLSKRLDEAGLEAVPGVEERFALAGEAGTEGRSVVRWLAPRDTPTAAPVPVVVLAAHSDSSGGVGADDNASGVAVVLEAARQVAEGWRAQRPEVGLVVAFPDAEERGLVGSTHLAGQLAERFDVRAVVNVDAVGRAATKPVHVIGLSTHPRLAERAVGALEASELEIGRDIDRFAYERGSDHWPFHERGVPAISLWASDYHVMNTAADTPEKVEVEGLVGVARAVTAIVSGELAAAGPR